jgi:hypothetical protein
VIQLDLPIGPTAPAGVADDSELRVRYDAYRHRQAARLLHMLPREAIRPLYGRARDAAREEGLIDLDAHDPLGLLVAYCERLLPLPTFEVWRDDLARFPDAHLTDLDEGPGGPTADAPSTMASRSVVHDKATWNARLRAFRDDAMWRGYIAFEEPATGGVHRTGTVFCERDLEELRKRFLSFDRPALEAFLRSALP